MSRESIGLSAELHRYLISVSPPEHPVLAELREETSRLEQRNMQISPEQGHFMAFLVRALGASRILEVGTFTGYSALTMALAAGDSARLVCCDVSEEWTTIARRYWRKAGVDARIDLRLGPALATLDQLGAEGATFDFAFIDADKPNYAAYYERCLELVRKGGVIAVDNTLWSGKVADPSVTDADTAAIREFNAMVAGDSRVTASVTPIGDGLTLLLRS
ncbi:MAG TPA: class I SAM-dependent methyltransferase [Gemmatimonadales bacterium]|nr:class I SAM-dependent methyltransferase [Gemmatimonadales bacterium]